SATGKISKIARKEKGGYQIIIDNPSDGRQVVDFVPPGPELLVSEGELIKADRSHQIQLGKKKDYYCS
ncbi:hypothetical protein P3S38_29210, partial [Enterobacter hormaechei]|uniref:hypothetical protein n=1 Tax=Enterobacter hormaechei TaxID=158836 RepID=UPI0023E3CD90